MATDKILLCLTQDNLNDLCPDDLEAVCQEMMDHPGAEFGYVDWEGLVFVVYIGVKPTPNAVAQFITGEY